jgi:aromatic-L-amino-acid/L-tryptophan decarboxylase
MTPEEFRALGHQVIDWLAHYMSTIEQHPVLSRVQPGEVLAQLPAEPPQQGLASRGSTDAWREVLADLDRIIIPALTHWQSPSFFAYFPCNASGPAILGELLSAGLNINGMLWSTSPAATELEIRVLDWMAAMLGLPETFMSASGRGGGIIQGTASESTLISLLAARQRTRHLSHKPDDAFTLYASEHAHSSVIKAAMIAGLARNPDDRQRLRLIPGDDNFAIRADLLHDALRSDLHAGLIPCWVCATVGTTSTTAIDPLDRIAAALADVNFAAQGGWLHVDAAHAGAACICPEYRWMLRGIEHADSLCFNPHKWLLTNFDCDCFWTRDRAALSDALSITPEYLRNRASESGQVIDYRDWQIPLGRRFRALKLWLVIRHYGIEGLQAYIREHIRLAALFEELVRQDDRFEIAAPRTINLVCFRLRGQGDAADARNRALLDAMNDSGRLFLTHSVLPLPGRGRQLVLRMAIGATATQERHIREAWALIQHCPQIDEIPQFGNS